MRFSWGGDLVRVVERIIFGLNGRLNFIDNMEVKIVSVSDTGDVDTEFTVTHNLGKVPTGYIANINQGGFVYDSDKANWTTIILKLKCTTANSALTLVVF